MPSRAAFLAAPALAASLDGALVAAEPPAPAEHPYVQASWEGFALAPLPGVSVKPRCLRAQGIDLLILDPGHDDSPGSRRSDALVRGQGGATQFLWPAIHEGQLAMATAWLVYDILLRDPSLEPAERAELRGMIRFTRHPGEVVYGAYEQEAADSLATQGAIDGGVTHRADRIRFLMENHRSPAGQVEDVTARTALLSIHANSSEFFGEGDLTWVIPPKGSAPDSGSAALARSLASGLSRHLSAYYTPLPGDPPDVVRAKEGAAPSALEAAISLREHPANLAVLRADLGDARTRKVLVEGFVMNGQAGYLANRELADPARLTFRRGGEPVASYDIAGLYIAYAQGIAQGIGEAYGCR